MEKKIYIYRCVLMKREIPGIAFWDTGGQEDFDRVMLRHIQIQTPS